MFASSQPARSVIEPLMPNSASRHYLRLMDHLLEVVGRAGARDVRCCLPGPLLCVITSLMIRRQSLSLPWRRPTHEGQMRATRHRVSSRNNSASPSVWTEPGRTPVHQQYNKQHRSAVVDVRLIAANDAGGAPGSRPR
jgi:hypothetical protein